MNSRPAPGMEPPRLSICIATYKRAGFIGATLDSILRQMQPGVEVVVVDGASPDDTGRVMAGYVTRHPALRYYREEQNSGVDADYDKAVGYARGDYCWLMTDDDVLHAGAIATILAALEPGTDLVVVNSDVCNADLSERLVERLLPLDADRDYAPPNRDAFFADTAGYLSFIGAVVIRRELWMARDRARYFGSLFIHVGVIFQAPLSGVVRVLARPLIRLRYGNAMWTPRSFEIWMFKWPRLLWSFGDLSEAARRAVADPEPWRKPRVLFMYRAKGAYSLREYRQYLRGASAWRQRVVQVLVALCPGRLANVAEMLLAVRRARLDRMLCADLLASRYSNWASRLIGRTAPLAPAVNGVES